MGADIISGVLHHVTGYTGFSGDPAEQTGNYIALKVDSDEDATITVELVGGNLGHPVELDSDRNIVIRISDIHTQSLIVTSTVDGETVEKRYSLAGLVLE